ncbi:DUF4292 domain-containing protein [Deminuibacter soli]|uniref:DUF4292 domain-containing protein n=1 Tax=Deminuibacter soli TaxID=2291815 RepID=A0A3E1NNZ3_9BACT|nr:DUF4292 domain-containing protein [Deminuibacter soli]RFM29656.1 DUF4292 domain-containing protein [Deminuibacter soli]
MRYILYGCMAVLLWASCRPAKKVQRIENAISKKDTVQKVMVKKDEVDSLTIVKDIVHNLKTKRIDFTTFSAKVKVDYEDKNGGDGANANIQMQKDSAIWIQLTGPFGIEGYRLLVTRDSVKLMNKLNKTVVYRSISYLKDLTQIPFDFYTLQDLIVGNTIFADGNIVSYKNADAGLQVLIVGKIFKHLLTLDKNTNLVMHSKLDDVDSVRNRTCDITFSQYQPNGDVNFSAYRQIAVAEQSRLDVKLDFKKYIFNQPVTFPFNIPKNFKRK